MARALDADTVLIQELLAPPPVEDARRSLEFWTARRRSLPLYRRAARREAGEMADRWRERLAAAERARFQASWRGRALAALGVADLPRFGLLAPLVLRFAWRFAPPQLRVVALAALAIPLLVVMLL